MISTWLERLNSARSLLFAYFHFLLFFLLCEWSDFSVDVDGGDGGGEKSLSHNICNFSQIMLKKNLLTVALVIVISHSLYRSFECEMLLEFVVTQRNSKNKRRFSLFSPHSLLPFLSNDKRFNFCYSNNSNVCKLKTDLKSSNLNYFNYNSSVRGDNNPKVYNIVHLNCI